jgi:hypothetical protein
MSKWIILGIYNIITGACGNWPNGKRIKRAWSGTSGCATYYGLQLIIDLHNQWLTVFQ